MAARIDDLGLGQDELDEGDVQPVVGHLIDEERPVGPPLHARSLQIFLAKVAPGGRIQVEHSLRIVAHLPRQHRNVLKLGRALDQAVAGKDLLEQRRARPWQADDEDGVRSLTSAGAIGKGLSREFLDAAIDDYRERLRAIRMGLEAQGVARRVMCEGFVGAAGIVKRLAEREVGCARDPGRSIPASSAPPASPRYRHPRT